MRSPAPAGVDGYGPPVEGRTFREEEARELYAAYGLSLDDMPADMAPRAVSTGLCDILLPVSTREALEAAVQNEAAVTELSRRYQVVGIHMFWPSLERGETAHCRNFAPSTRSQRRRPQAPPTAP